MEEDKNLEQNLDKSDEKLHISDVITSCGRDRTKNSCVKCGEEFETWIKIDTGDYDEIFCSDKCGTEYYGATEFN
jgi:NAD-dependent SIR2 family protein deacetylase